MYVGKISPNLTKRELRAQFEYFGVVEETSVHLRESGGYELPEIVVHHHRPIGQPNKEETES